MEDHDHGLAALRRIPAANRARDSRGHPDARLTRPDVPIAGGSATEDELITHLRNRLAGYKIPQAMVFRDSLPRTASGKVSKSQLRTERT